MKINPVILRHVESMKFKSFKLPWLNVINLTTILQSWSLISRHMRNVAEKCFSANVPKVLIFGLLVRTGTINDFSY